jgi:hypothetical protein
METSVETIDFRGNTANTASDNSQGNNNCHRGEEKKDRLHRKS